MPVDFSVTNQLASPAIYASSFATRPAASFNGRLFVDTDNPSTGIYRDTGTAWIAIAGTGVAETQNLESVCQIGNTATTGILITGQSAFGTLSGSPISPVGDYTVTIGETSVENPANSLFVKYTALFEQNIIVQTNTTTPLLIGGDTTTSTLTYRTTSAAGITGARHIFQVGNNGATEAMTILNNGNIVLNSTTDAGFKFDCNGTGRFVNGVNMATTSGNVGIGTTNPTEKLSVSGNIVLDDMPANGNRYLLTNESNTGTGRLTIQAGSGSAAFGGGLSLFANQHATKPGWVTAGISSGAGTPGTANEGRFTVNDQGLGFGTDIFTVLRTGNVGIGTTSPAASSLLDVTSTTKGFLPPRMTTVQKNAIATPAAGLVIYDTTLNKLCVFTTAWETITSI